MLIETAKTAGWERGTQITPDPLDMKNLTTLRNLRTSQIPNPQPPKPNVIPNPNAQ